MYMRRGELHTDFLVGKLEGKRPLGRHRRRWDDVEKYHQEIGWGEWTELIWLKVGKRRLRFT